MTDKNGVGVTVISHDSENRKFVNGCKTRGCYSRDIRYIRASLSQLASLTEVSSHCEQFIKYECFHSRLLKSNNNRKDPFGWWVSRNSSQMTYWRGAEPSRNKCACGMTNSCEGMETVIVTKKMRNGVQTADSSLINPLSQLHSFDLETGFSKNNLRDEKGYQTLGKLKCYMNSTNARLHNRNKEQWSYLGNMFQHISRFFFFFFRFFFIFSNNGTQNFLSFPGDVSLGLPSARVFCTLIYLWWELETTWSLL